MRILAIIDPPVLLDPYTDTTVAILDEVVARGHEAAVCEVGDLGLQMGDPIAEVRWISEVSRSARPALHLRAGAKEARGLRDFHAVLMRKDPPYDETYHLATLLLERARGQTLLVNDPRGLRDANEKLYIFHFPDLLAPTIVTNREARLWAFLEEQGGEIIVKPVDGHGGSGIFYVRRGDRNARSIFETATRDGRKWVMAQRYLPAAREGDKRILLLEGQPIGAVLRVPAEDDTRGNMHVGGTATRTELTERDLEICARIAPRLVQDGLSFVGIDVIGGYLTEVNVTSPTGIQQMDRLHQTRVENKVVDWLQERAPRLL